MKMSIMSFSKLSVAAIVAAVALSGMTSSASAGGVIGDLIGGDLGRALDSVHREIGAPLNAVPGQIVRRLPGGQLFGDYCDTPIGVFGPGPLRPLGAPCHARGYRGFIVD
jgi:hypothetical protein